MIILIPLSALIEVIVILFFIVVVAQIDISATTTNMASQHVLGIFIVFFVINLLVVSTITLFGLMVNTEKENKRVIIIDTLSVAYKAVIVGIYGFTWGTFMCVPSLVGKTQFGILEQGINFIGSLILPFLHLLVQLLIWLPIIFAEECASRIKENVVLDAIIRMIACVICTYLANRWLFGHSVPYLIDLCERETIELIYGSNIFNALERIGFIQ